MKHVTGEASGKVARKTEKDPRRMKARREGCDGGGGGPARGAGIAEEMCDGIRGDAFGKAGKTSFEARARIDRVL